VITEEQIHDIARRKRVNETVVYREYLQVLLLSRLYSRKESENIFFKGGTAIHLIFKAPRFSEDLDFTVELEERYFLSFVSEFFGDLSKEENVEFKERKSIAGKRFLMTAPTVVLPYKTFINLDFSFREKIFEPQKSFIETDYPVLFTSYVYHPSREEIFAEKIRAFVTRSKGRDLYDLWYLLTKEAMIKDSLVKEKLKYYNLENIGKAKILKTIEKFSKKDFILDVRPLVPVNERNKLGDFFDYICDFLKKSLIRGNWQDS